MRRAVPQEGPVIRVVQVESSRLVTIGPDSACWAECAAPHIASLVKQQILSQCDGAFVRIIPPAECADGLVTSMVDAVRAAGAKQVRAQAPAKGRVLPLDAVIDMPRLGHREVVLALVEEARCPYVDELRVLCSEVMDGVGV